jgi:protein-L-isoaspartate(D-aspartate) O-methyltransferase
MDRLSDFRAVFAEVVAARGACRDPLIKAAFARVPRHEFLDPGPWQLDQDGPQTESDDPAIVYQDIALGISRGVALPTGLPSLHARCMDACRPAAGEHVIHVGAGRGYFTALLAELVTPTGTVRAFEVEPSLAAMAERALSRWPNVRVEARSGTGDHDSADVIYVSAGVQQIPLGWLRALREDGRLILPLVPGDIEGGVLLVIRRGGAFEARFVAPARFVPCIGATDPHAVGTLRAAFARGQSSSVRSLRVAPETPDDSCWFAGTDWWLSSRERAAER